MSLEYVHLGPTGTSVSEIAFGTWRFGRETDSGDHEVKHDQAFELLDAYADHGGNFIDTADVYGSGRAENWIGEWLESRDREKFVLASKIYWPTSDTDPNRQGLGRKHLRRQLDLILDRLGTNYLDLLYIHRWDDHTPAEEFMRTLNGFVSDGRVNHLGTSTLTPNAWKIARANEIAKQRQYEPFTVSQPRYNLVNQEIERNYLDMCRQYDLGVIPWSPLAGGFLTGKYTEGEPPPSGSRADMDHWFADNYLTPENFRVLDVLKQVADDVGLSPAQVSLAWLLHHEQVTAPIIGARTIDQLEENLAATEIDLTSEQLEELTNAG